MKIRRVDFSPDEFLVGVTGMPADEIGVYWVVCCLIYSSGGAIPVDDERIKRLSGASHQRLPHIIKSLVEKRHKLDLDGGLLSNKRATKELARAEHRVSSARDNGGKGGRPSSDNKDIEKPAGSEEEKLTSNSQLPSINPNAADERETLRHARIAVMAELGVEKDPNWLGDAGIVGSWLNSGADLELDILPTIRRVMGRRGQGPPRSLSYFNQAIADAMATRTKPLPTGTPRKPDAARSSPQAAQYAGFAIAVNRIEQSEADRGADRDAPGALLDSPGYPRIAVVGGG